MAHLIGLGWLRCEAWRLARRQIGLDFSPERAKVRAQQDLVDYFAEGLKTLPLTLAHTQLFEKFAPASTLFAFPQAKEPQRD